MMHIQPLLIAQLLVLLAMANGAPVIAMRILELFSRVLLMEGSLWQMGSQYSAIPKPFAASRSRSSRPPWARS